MRVRVLALVVVLSMSAFDRTVAAPPICDDPAAVPAELGVIVHSELVTKVGFDSTYIFQRGSTVIERRRLNASQLLTRTLPYGIAWARLGLMDQRVYVAEVASKLVRALNYDLNEVAVLFTSDPSMQPGGMVGQSGPLGVHPETRDLYAAPVAAVIWFYPS